MEDYTYQVMTDDGKSETGVEVGFEDGKWFVDNKGNKTYYDSEYELKNHKEWT